MNVSTFTIDQFNTSFLNKTIHFLSPKKTFVNFFACQLTQVFPICGHLHVFI